MVGRLAEPWQLIRIATRAAASNDENRVADTPFAVAVSIVLADLECMLNDLQAGLKVRRQVAPLVRAICAAVHGVGTELSFSTDSRWSRRFAAIRGDLASVLKTAIEQAPVRVRRLLRPRAVKDLAAGSVLEANEVNDAEMQLDLIIACREPAEELGVGEASARAYSDLQHYLEGSAKILLDSLGTRATPIGRSANRKCKPPSDFAGSRSGRIMPASWPRLPRWRRKRWRGHRARA